MKKKYSFLFFLSTLIIILLSSYNLNAEEKKKTLPHMSNREACQAYYNKVATSTDPRATGPYFYYSYKDFGFDVKKTLNEDLTKEKILRNEDGYLIVGNIYNPIVSKKINVGDIILSIDGIDYKNKKAREFYSFSNDKEYGDSSKILLKTEEGKKYEVDIEVSNNSYTEVDYKLKDLSINDIDIKNNNYSVSVDQGFRYWWGYKNNLNKDTPHILYKLTLGNIIFEEFPGEWFPYVCYPDDDDFFYSQLLDPATYSVRNLKSADKSLERRKNIITPYSKLKGVDDAMNALAVEVRQSNVFEVKNQFNLRSFPFDKQKLIFELKDDVYNNDVRNLTVGKTSYETLNNFMKLDDIPGWVKQKYEFNYTSVQIPGMQKSDYAQGVRLEIVLERKVGYYIFKVIFPIILILLICWASVWINPKELESRLTITIVCFLSLIAYNFVIDSELPKLEYLTVLDWIILISYVYATIPNILSVYSFRISSANKVLCDKVERAAREFGITSYIGLIILTIMLNANLNPENSGFLISWMAFNN